MMQSVSLQSRHASMQEGIISWLELCPNFAIPIDHEMEMLHGDPQTPTHSPKKRKGAHEQAVDPNQTPTQALVNYRLTDSASDASSLTSGGSRASSPSKTKESLANAPQDAIRFHTISDIPQTHPQAARIVREMRNIGKGRSFLPARVRRLVEPFLDPDDAAFVFHENRGADSLPGNIPPPEVLQSLVHRAARLEALNAIEASWNEEIHHRLMQLVLRPYPNEELVLPGDNKMEMRHRPPGEIHDPLVDVLNATSADTYYPYRPSHALPKKVDYIIFINPESDPGRESVRTRLLEFARLTHTGTVNPTTYPSLTQLPIAVPIETKKPGAGSAKADVQAGVWHASQWKFLNTHLCRSSPSLRDGEAFSSTDAHSAQLEDSPNPLSSLFIPGLIVEGHDWRFIFSTWDSTDGTTTVWGNVLIGTTRTIVEAYQVVAALQVLIDWAQNTYWPFFQKEILIMGRERCV
ncbi:hypothetical protein MKZ38_007313 [Zalerion maritima]|uniref:PD-(D/E)XK nuclease-like domain-containing protein n=1 Tax=Zalerion maritima TaxID=339359 RepID=A0AAD5WMZ9_9PEZI|nr:hypothetical protein MKZ38_007313 [Zalerion maritima]